MITALSDYEATLDRTVLHRCAVCFELGKITPHPIVTGDPPDHCPECGAPARATVLPTVDAIVSGAN